MDRCGLLTDSLVQFPADEELLLEQIAIAKIKVLFDGIHGTDADHDLINFLPLKADDNSNPQLVALSAAQFEKLFRLLLLNHEHVIGLFSSSKVSPSFQNAMQAVELSNEGDRISIIDSRSISTGLGNLCRLALKTSQKGFDFRLIEEEVRSSLDNSYFIACVPSPTYLFYSGLSDFTQSLSSEILSLFPVVSLEDGDLKIIKKVKTIRSASEIFIDYLSEFDSLHEVSLIYSQNGYEKETDIVEQFCSENHPSTRLFHLPLNYELASIFGPNSIALSVVER